MKSLVENWFVDDRPADGSTRKVQAVQELDMYDMPPTLTIWMGEIWWTDDQPLLGFMMIYAPNGQTPSDRAKSWREATLTAQSMQKDGWGWSESVGYVSKWLAPQNGCCVTKKWPHVRSKSRYHFLKQIQVWPFGLYMDLYVYIIYIYVYIYIHMYIYIMYIYNYTYNGWYMGCTWVIYEYLKW